MLGNFQLAAGILAGTIIGMVVSRWVVEKYGSDAASALLEWTFIAGVLIILVSMITGVR